MGDAILLGKMMERVRNRYGIRDCGVRVGSRVCPAPEHVEPMLRVLFENIGNFEPLEFYREFEQIHPFVDGNGRTGKVLLNWLNGSLENPVFPPSDFWGHPIRNP